MILRLLKWLPQLIARANRAANHDFCPQLNQYVYWLKQPVGWFLVAFAAALISGIFIGPQGYLLAIAIGLITTLGVFWPWLCLRGIQTTIRFQRRCITEQDRVVILVSVVNRWPIPVWGLALEGGFRKLSSDREELPWLSLSGIGPWTVTEFEWSLDDSTRGVYPIETPRMTNGFPFGLWRCQKDILVQGEVLVRPRTYPLRSLPEIIGNELALEGCESLRAGQEGDVVDIREFRRGDRLRQVHWAQTARRGYLMVRERQNKSRREVRVTVDLDPEIHFGTGRGASLEWALRIAASICQEFHGHHYHVRCLLGRQVVNVPDQMNGIGPILDAMARFQIGNGMDSLVQARPNDRNESNADVLDYVITTSNRLLSETSPVSPDRNRVAGLIVLHPSAESLADTAVAADEGRLVSPFGKSLDLANAGMLPLPDVAMNGASHVFG